MAQQTKFEYEIKLLQKDIKYIRESQNHIREDIRDIRKKIDDDAKTKKQLIWKKIALGVGIATLIVSIFFNIWLINQSKSSNEPKDKPMGKSSQMEKDSTKTKK